MASSLLSSSPQGFGNLASTSASNPAVSPHESVWQSRTAIKAELSGKLVFDQHNVLSRLGTSKVDEIVTKGCLNTLKHTDFTRHWKKLDNIVKKAENSAHPVNRETEMYLYLVNLLPEHVSNRIR